MAAMDEPDRAATAAHWMRKNTTPVAVTKQQLRLALDAADNWLDSNAAAFNAALPAAFRTSATASQKTFLLCLVAMRRQGILRTEGD